MPRRFRINGPLLSGLFSAILGLVVYVCWPILWGEVELDPQLRHTTVDLLRERGITAVTGLWFFVFGATIGSFLNVVAYRMPMGLTVVSKPSRCPYCETPILFRHNMPIFGWLALRGRCYGCRLPISIRYPLVEIIVGLLFFILFWRELASGGANLPLLKSGHRSGILWNVLSPNWPLIQLYAFHALLLGILSTIALIKFDRLRIPIKLGCFAIVVAFACRMIWPQLNVVPWWSPAATPISLDPIWQRIADPLSGLVVGLLVGWSVHHLIDNRRWLKSNSSQTGIVVACGIVGTFLAWQVVVPFLFLAVLAQFFSMFVGQVIGQETRTMWAASCLWATLTTICLWKQLPLLGLPSPSSSVGYHWAWLLVTLAAAYVTTQFSSAAEDR